MKPGKDTLRLLLVRHGETIWNAEDRLIGRTDLPLSEGGVQQARRLAARLATENIAVIYTSEMIRAMETATAIGEACQLSPRPDPRLHELDLGQWEGLTYDILTRRFPDELAAWRDAESPQAPPDGETPEHLTGRVGEFIDDLLDRHRGETVAVVSHGGVFQTLIFLALGFPFRNDWYFYMFNGSISELWLNGESAVIVRLNDTGHLDKGSD